jgi:TRAP-type C4-dicarboxylate transport system permease small subunit
MTTKPDLTPEEAREWRLAKLFDLRSFIGALFVIFGVLLIIPGLSASKATIAKAAGINLQLWVGAIMLAGGLLFLLWVLLRPPAPITQAQAEQLRKEREEFGTSSPTGH